jgi:hypothetical protein
MGKQLPGFSMLNGTLELAIKDFISSVMSPFINVLSKPSAGSM